MSIQQASSLMSWPWTDPVRPSAPITPDTSLKVRWSSCACNVSGVSSWTRDDNVRTHSSSDLQDICGFSCDDLSSMFKELKGLGVVVKQLSNELRQVVRIESSCLCDVHACVSPPVFSYNALPLFFIWLSDSRQQLNQDSDSKPRRSLSAQRHRLQKQSRVDGGQLHTLHLSGMGLHTVCVSIFRNWDLYIIWKSGIWACKKILIFRKSSLKLFKLSS